MKKNPRQEGGHMSMEKKCKVCGEITASYVRIDGCVTCFKCVPRITKKVRCAICDEPTGAYSGTTIRLSDEVVCTACRTKFSSAAD